MAIIATNSSPLLYCVMSMGGNKGAERAERIKKVQLGHSSQRKIFFHKRGKGVLPVTGILKKNEISGDDGNIPSTVHHVRIPPGNGFNGARQGRTDFSRRYVVVCLAMALSCRSLVDRGWMMW